MRDYKIKAPDGRVMTIRGPEDASPEQLSAAASAAFERQPASAPAQPTAPAQEPTAPPQAGMSRMEKIGTGMMDPVHGGAQLLTNMLPEGLVSGVNTANNWLADKTGLVARVPEGGVDQMVREREAEYQARRAAAGETGFDGYRMTGNVLSPANLAIAARTPAAVSLLGRIGVGAASGAGSAALNPVTEGDFGEGKRDQMMMGAAAGGALPVVTNALSRVVNPNAAQNPQLALLRSEGVRPSIGQTLGGNWNSAEQRATSIPIVGDMISRTRGNALRDFNNAAINRAGAPIGESVEGAGTGAVREIGDRLGLAYDAGKARLGNFQLDNQAAGELTTVAQMASNLPAKEQASFRRLMDIVRNEVSPNGTILPDQFKRLDAKIGAEARQFGGSSDVYQQKLGEAAKELQRVITDAARRANPQGAGALDAADAGWANLVRVEAAAKAAANNEGVFTPAQLMNAIKATDQSVRGRGVARGGALMQDLADAGQTVLGNKIPDSGTAGRLGWGALGATGWAAPLTTAATIGGGSAIYTDPVQNILRAMVSQRGASAAPIANALRRGSPALSPAAAQALLESRN